MNVHYERIDVAGYDGRRLGRHIRHDPRSRDYAFDTTGLDIRSVRHDRMIPVLDQGDIGSCTGNAMVGALGTSPCWEPIGDRVTLDEGLAVDIYSEATSLDDFQGTFPPQDTGSDGLSVCKVAKARGLISEYRWTFTLEDALRALSVGPILAGLPWYSSFNAPDETGYIGITADASVVGGHEVVLDEVDVERELVWFTNSWGNGWGDGGRACMSWPTLARLLDERGDIAVPVPAADAQPGPDDGPNALLAALLRMVEALRELIAKLAKALGLVAY